MAFFVLCKNNCIWDLLRISTTGTCIEDNDHIWPTAHMGEEWESRVGQWRKQIEKKKQILTDRPRIYWCTREWDVSRQIWLTNIRPKTTDANDLCSIIIVLWHLHPLDILRISIRCVFFYFMNLYIPYSSNMDTYYWTTSSRTEIIDS